MTLLVVDDDRAYLKSFNELLQLLIAPGCTVFEADDGSKAIEMIACSKPDAVLLDVSMPGLNGLQVTQQIFARHPDTKIIINTNIHGEAMVVNLIKAGVHGFVFKTTSWKDVKKCIELVVTGQKYFCYEADDIFQRNFSGGFFNETPKVNIAKREIELIRLIKDGKANKEISAILGLKENTLNSYRKELLRKTRTRNAAELVAFGFNNGLI